MGQLRRTKLIEQRADIWDASGGICYYCKKPMHPIREFTVDHLIPLSKGGTDDAQNLVASCWECNFKKGARLLEKPLPPYPASVMTIDELASTAAIDPVYLRDQLKLWQHKEVRLSGRRRVILIDDAS